MNEEKFTLNELLISISKGEVEEGDIFETTSGKVIYHSKQLCWLSEKGYVLSPLQITEETIDLTYMRLQDVEEIDFFQALKEIEEGNVVTIRFEFFEGTVVYNIEEISALDELIKDYCFSVIYKSGRFFISKSPKKTNVWSDDVAAQVTNYKKLTFEDAYNINILYHLTDGVTALDISSQYGISDRMVYYVANGTYWAEAHEQFKKDYSWGVD